MPDVPFWSLAVDSNNMEVILDMLQDCKVEPWNMIQQEELLQLLGRVDEVVVRSRRL